jgi:hypothetical protein
MRSIAVQASILLVRSPNAHAETFFANQKRSLPPFAGRSLTTHKTSRTVPVSLQIISNIRGGGEIDASKIVDESYGWLMSLGAPAALVAGAVIGSLYEFNRNDDLELEKKDGKLIKTAKKFSKLLLVFAFALELLSIFVVTVMGTGKNTATLRQWGISCNFEKYLLRFTQNHLRNQF